MNHDASRAQKKLRSYRSARLGCIFLAAVSTFALILTLATGQTDDGLRGPVYAATFVWPALAYICHLKIRLIEIELRNQARPLRGDPNAEPPVSHAPIL